MRQIVLLDRGVRSDHKQGRGDAGGDLPDFHEAIQNIELWIEQNDRVDLEVINHRVDHGAPAHRCAQCNARKVARMMLVEPASGRLHVGPFRRPHPQYAIGDGGVAMVTDIHRDD